MKKYKCTRTNNWRKER